MINIVEASVNGVRLWRVYINQEVVATFPSHEEALKYAAEKARFRSEDLKNSHESYDNDDFDYDISNSML